MLGNNTCQDVSRSGFMAIFCRHRAEKALEVYWKRPINRKESATLVTALMNPQASVAHLILMENIGLRMNEAVQIYQSYAPQECHCDSDLESTSQLAA